MTPDWRPSPSSKSLLELDLSYSNCLEPNGLAVYSNAMPQLETLYVNDTAISDKGLAHLKGHPGLKVLFLNGTKITNKGLDESGHASLILII